jgi:hypothetical protein
MMIFRTEGILPPQPRKYPPVGDRLAGEAKP